MQAITTFLAFFAVLSFLWSAVALPVESGNATALDKRTTYNNARFTYFYEKGTGACGGQNTNNEHVSDILL